MTKHLIDGEELTALLGYQLQMANLHLMELAHKALNNFQITPAKVTALMLIRDNPGCEQSALGRALSINRSSAMKLVNTLVERGLAERRSGKDLRSNALHLTSQGEVELARMTAVLRETEDRASAVLTPQQRADLLRLLGKLRQGVGQPRKG